MLNGLTVQQTSINGPLFPDLNRQAQEGEGDASSLAIGGNWGMYSRMSICGWNTQI